MQVFAFVLLATSKQIRLVHKKDDGNVFKATVIDNHIKNRSWFDNTIRSSIF